jgi:hypothetical protein
MNRHELDPVSLIFGFAFTGLGLLFLIGRADQALRLQWVWPLLLLALGAGILLDLTRSQNRRALEPGPDVGAGPGVGVEPGVEPGVGARGEAGSEVAAGAGGGPKAGVEDWAGGGSEAEVEDGVAAGPRAEGPVDNREQLR